MPNEDTRAVIPSPDARSARSPYKGRTRPLFTVGGAASVGTFTIVINILNTETVTIDGKVYTFQDTLTDVDGNVHIGATAEDTLDNLVAAINRSNEGESAIGPGTDYAVAMTEHPTVSAVDGAALTVDVTAKFTGSAGDLIATLEGITDAGAVWGAGTLASGADPTAETAWCPVVQWSQMRIRVQISGADGTLGVEFGRPAREKEPNTDGTSFVYGADVPAVDGTALADGVEQGLEITAAEHIGENWMRLSLVVDDSRALIDFLDVSGELLGTYH